MKKLFNSRFLFILASSLIVLILLVVGAFYLFDDEDDTFVMSGYVLNPLSSTTEKYFFDENVGYRENLSSMIEFKDVDDNTVTILKDSFIHYMDESISFLKNGAILDLDSLKGDKAVSFYNITNESIIENVDGGYVIESANGNINLNNFIGRISDNKYIVVGDLSLKVPGNSTTVKGDYFEIVYVEEGIVNIENKNVKYQVAADDTLIYFGSDKVIDLGDKKITLNGEDVMSITAITINGDENIEIIPKAQDDEPDNSSGTNGNDGSNEGTGTEGNNGGGTGTGDGTTTGEGTGGTGTTGVDGEKAQELVVSLKNAEIGSTNADVTFDILNATADDTFKLQVVNLASGRTVDMVAQVLADVEIQVNLLTPNTKYLFMVINEKDNNKYFQKVFETASFGIKLEKTYATESSLAFKVSIEEGTDITNAKLSLYKFNEETKQNEIVTSSYVDSTTGEVKYVEKVTYLSTIQGNLEGEHEIVYDGLDNNTIYTAVLDEFSVASSNFKDIYNITVTSMTLKKTPIFSEMTISKDVSAGSFDLSLGNITDPDNAIVSYTYMIYDKFDETLAIEPIVHNNASPITVKVGTDNNQLKSDTNYYYKVVIEYYDNEKYIEYVTTDSLIFNMGNDPYITVVPNDELITHDQIGATIYLRDSSCLISMPGREKCVGSSSTVVEVSRVNPITGELTPVYTKLVTFDVEDEEIKYELLVENLQPGTTYSVDVRAQLNNTSGLERQEILHTDESKRLISTKSFTTFTVDWVSRTGNEAYPIIADAQLIGDENSGTLSPDESAESIERVIFKLYDGRNIQDIDTKIPIASKVYTDSTSFDIKEQFYDNAFQITSDSTFGLTLEDLIARSTGGELNEYYTIVMEAYDENSNQFTLVNNVLTYRVSPSIFAKAETTLEFTPISNVRSGKIFSDLTNDGTIVGYTAHAYYDRSELIAWDLKPVEINFYVYNDNKKKIDFYIKNEAGELELVNYYSADISELEANTYDLNIYMGYGTSYETVDEVMRRGNSFYIGYELVVETSKKEQSLYPALGDGSSPSGYGLYKSMYATKEAPNLKMYIATSDSDSITYEYTIKDPDNAIFKPSDSENYSFYYTVRNGEENKIDMIKVNDEDGSLNYFEGRLTIEGLRNGDLYSLYYKINEQKTGVFETDVKSYLDGTSGIRTFDGYYDVESSDDYNFKYQIINNPLKDNKVVIKILADDEILERILSYKVTFKSKNSDGVEEVINKELWELSVCDDDNSDDSPRCLSVDYRELESMKSSEDENRLISVEVVALYDNGLTGYDFKVGNTDDADYLYMIMQDNSSEAGAGNYIILEGANNPVVAIWKSGITKGYYTYKLNRNTGTLTYTSQLTGKSASTNANLSSTGFYSKNGVLNPKMVSMDEMGCYSTSTASTCNTFSFSSITPKVKVESRTSLINGSVMNLTLSGIDLDDLKNEGTKSDPQYYLYIDTWEKSSIAELDEDENVEESEKFDYVVRPRLKVKIDNDNPTATISAVIDGLKEYNYSNGTGTYYFNVYAYMNKNGKYILTRLFDEGVKDGFEVKTYSFTSLKASDLFHSVNIGVSASDEIYGNRILNTKINLLAYKNNTAYNFDIVYVLCNLEDAATCGPNEGETNIFKKTIAKADLATIMEDKVDISEYDLEFGKNYLLLIYASSDYYDSENGNAKTTRNVLINTYARNVSFRKLVEPSFVVTRNAILDNDNYAIDFNIVVNDSDRTLVNGNYYIKLLDSKGNVVGNMKLLDEDGNYYDVGNYQEYAFDAFVVNKKVRITGLEPNTQYTFVVYNDAYLNNYSEDTQPGKEYRTYEVSKSYTVYSTNNYGVAFGTATYGVTEKSVVVTFLGGSNFDNVSEVNYTVGLWDDEQSTSSLNGTFVIGENNKYFELYKTSEDWRFVIDPAGMKNTLNKTYKVNISFKVKVPGTDNYVVLTSADVPSFEGTVTYYEDEK